MTPLFVYLTFLAFVIFCAIGDAIVRAVDPENKIADWLFRL